MYKSVSVFMQKDDVQASNVPALRIIFCAMSSANAPRQVDARMWSWSWMMRRKTQKKKLMIKMTKVKSRMALIIIVLCQNSEKQSIFFFLIR